MLTGKLFTVKKIGVDEKSVKAVVGINVKHAIFEGHFPGQPVLPGVTMMQLVKELLKQGLGEKLRLVEADNIKFLSMIDPRSTLEVDADVSFVRAENGIHVAATLFAGTVTFFKLKALFKNA